MGPIFRHFDPPRDPGTPKMPLESLKKYLTSKISFMSSLINNWHEILDEVGVAREGLSQGILSNSAKESTKRRLNLIEKTNLLAVDEIHKQY